MSRFLVGSVSLATLALLAVAPSARADTVSDVTKFTGTATDIGVVRRAGQTGGVEYRFHGQFVHPSLDLSNSTFTWTQAFVEPGGSGELMHLLQGNGGPETDTPWPAGGISMTTTGGDPDDAKYETPGRFRPQIRIQVERDPIKGSPNDLWQFDVRLDRGLARVRPVNCVLESDGRTRTIMLISFTITDNNNPASPVVVSFTKKWECSQPDRYHMRSR